MSQKRHLNHCIQLLIIKCPSRKVSNFRHLLGCDTIVLYCFVPNIRAAVSTPMNALKLCNLYHLVINGVFTSVKLRPVKFFNGYSVSETYIWFRFKLFMYNFVLLQKEISHTRVRKIIFDHLIILITFISLVHEPPRHSGWSVRLATERL